MKILSITAQKPHSTGSGTYLTELVRAFDRQGVEQSVVAGIYRDDEVCFPEGVKFYPVYFTHTDDTVVDGDISFPVCGMSDVMPYESTMYRNMTPEMVEEYEAAFMKQIELAVSELDPDIILCHHLFLLTALVRKNYPDRRIYAVCHGTCLRQMVNCEDLLDIVRPEILKLTKVFALHNEQAENIFEICGINEEQLCVIGSGYNDELFNCSDRVARIPGEPVRIIYAGKMSRPKGVPELLIAAGRLAEDADVPAFTLTLAGGCRDDSVQVKLDARPYYVNYLGQIPQTELAAQLKSNDIFVLPSYFEGLNLAVIEAMASGLLPICTDLPGMRDWVDDNVDNANIRYITMPEMQTVDTPTDSGREMFCNELELLLKQAILDIHNGRKIAVPNTSRISWNSVANKIINLY